MHLPNPFISFNLLLPFQTYCFFTLPISNLCRDWLKYMENFLYHFLFMICLRFIRFLPISCRRNVRLIHTDLHEFYLGFSSLLEYINRRRLHARYPFTTLTLAVYSPINHTVSKMNAGSTVFIMRFSVFHASFHLPRK